MAVVDADSTWGSPVKGVGGWRLQGLGEAWRLEVSRLMVWSPLLLVLGIWTYFSLQREPPVWMAWPLLIASLFLVLWPRVPRGAKLIAIVMLGFAAAHARAQWVATPLLRAYAPAQVVEGIVSDVDVRARQRFTIILDVTSAVGLPDAERPRRALFSITGKHVVPQVGDRVRLTADLAPLPRPAQPDGFDYGRQLYFQSIGATGRSKTGVEVLPGDVPWRFLMRRGFHDLRVAIGTRVRDAIPGPLGSFADALITGERATIPRAMNNSLQESGLFHILSISGLHMALVAGGAFWVARAVFALSPALALGWPIKKWSAALAIIVGLLYMLLADSGPATERSFIMIAVVFFAVLVDRPALSMHNLALAAVVILITAPEQALAASFQMSFMAVMGLAAFFQWWQRAVPVSAGAAQNSVASRWRRKIVVLSVASLATSLVAGVLSGIPAAHHFGRLAPYGVVANALALPIVSVVVMPAAMASVILMPLGLEVVPLKVMAIGLSAVMAVSDWVASWPGAGLRLPRLGAAEAALLSVALALLLLPQTKMRWFAVPLFALSLLWIAVPRPDTLLMVDERAGNVALHTPDGLVPALADRAPANVARWLAQSGDNASVKLAFQRKGWTCRGNVCDSVQSGHRIAFLLKSVMPAAACPQADILISQEPLRRRCKGRLLTIDRFDVWRHGAYEVFADGTFRTVRGQQGARGWVYEPRAKSKLAVAPAS
jgi:competence protein ComEC